MPSFFPRRFAAGFSLLWFVVLVAAPLGFCVPRARAQVPTMTLTKDDGVKSVDWNQIITYNLVFTNTATAPGDVANNVVIQDTFPLDGLFYNSCSFVAPITGTCSESGGIVTFTIDGSFGPGQGGTVQINAEVIGERSGDIVNSATLTCEDSEATPCTPVTATDTDTINEPNFLYVNLTKSDNRETVAPGDVLDYVITAQNSSDSAEWAMQMVISDTLPANTTYISCASEVALELPCSESGGFVTFYLTDPLEIGATASVTVTVQVNAGASGEIVNIAQLDYQNGSEQQRPTLYANDTDTVQASGAIDVGLTIDSQTKEVIPGKPLTYTLTYSNQGSLLARGLVITETVPANTTFDANASTQGWSCPDASPAGTVCTFMIPDPVIDPPPLVRSSIGLQQQGNLTFVVHVAAPLPAGVAQVSNTASIGDDGSQGADANQSNNTATITLNVQPTAITLRYLHAERSDSSVLIAWATDSSDQSLGFHVLRSSDGLRAHAERVTTSLIPVASHGRAEYSWTDVSATDGTWTYWLQEIELSGAVNEYGPVRTTTTQLAATYRILLPVVRR